MNGMFIAAFDREAPAKTLRNRLIQEGFQADVRDESKVQRFAFWVKPRAAIQVFVRNEDFEAALARVKEWDQNDSILAEAIHCPECHSLRIQYPQYTRKFIIPWVVEILGSIGLFTKEFYCQDCQFTWTDEVKVEPERD